MTATEENKPAAIKVSFTAKKTGKTSKYTFTSKVTVVAPKEDEPVAEAATKIVEAKASTAKTVNVTFDGAVDTTTATAIKLTRGNTEVTVKATYASDAKSVVLASDTALAAGTYTLKIGSFEAVTFMVTKQTPSKLEISSTTVANTANAGVGFQVLDQYGDPMSNYTAKKLEVQAYNTTKGHSVSVDLNINQSYFTLDCQTNNTTVVNGQSVINSLGDDISIVAYLKDNASISCTATLKITNIYMETLEFGEPELGSDKRITVNKTYKLPYTAKTNEDKDATFAKANTVAANTISRNFGDYTFVTNNVTSLDLGAMTVDKDGNMYFTAGGTAGTAVITAINNKTGKTVTTTIVVNDLPTVSRLDVADASVACNYTGKVQAAVTAYDQFDEAIDAKNLRNLAFTANALPNMLSYMPTPNTGNFSIVGFSSDGTKLIYNITGSNTSLAGQSVTFTFTSVKAGKTGYITSKSTLEINDRIEPNALKVTAVPDATKEEAGKVSIKVSVVDQYQNDVVLSPGTGNTLQYTAAVQGSVAATTYTVVPEFSGSVDTVAASLESDNKVGKFEFTLSNIDALNKDAKITVKLMNGADQLDSKTYNVTVTKALSTYYVAAEKTSYKAGESVKVFVDAYSTVNGTIVYNYNYNGDRTVYVQLLKNGAVVGNWANVRKVLTFKNGRAEFTDAAGAATSGTDKYSYKVVDVASTGVQSCVYANDDKFTVSAGSAGKLAIDSSNGYLRLQDAKGNNLTGGATDTFATFTVKDETLGKDISWDSTITNTNASSTVTLESLTTTAHLNENQVITKLDGKNYSAADGFSVTVPVASTGNKISLTITVNGCSWSQTVMAVGTTATYSDTDCGTARTDETTATQTFATTMGTSHGAINVSGTAINTNPAQVNTSSAIAVVRTDIHKKIDADMALNGYEVVSIEDKTPGTPLTMSQGGGNKTHAYTVTIRKKDGYGVTKTFDVTVTFKDDFS